MKCPNCGAQMEEGSLYCLECGEEIHIVPDFEPELELDIQQAIKGITDDIWEKDKTADTAKEESLKDSGEPVLRPPEKNTGRGSLSGRLWLRGMTAILSGIFVLAVISVLAVQILRYHSAEYQITRARECVTEMMYDEAVGYYERAIELNKTNVALKIELADVYFYKNEKEAYEELLYSIVKDGFATPKQMQDTYGKLIAVYRSRGDFQGINDLLLASNNEDIIETYQSYVVKEPEFSVKEGSYDGIQPLKLTTFGRNKIYFTTDGSEPDENSERYVSPILLEEGEHVVRAVAVNENGIHSKVVEKTYHITVNEVKAPEINVMSGEYQAPVDIEVVDDAENVYYTVDGKTPTEHSRRYAGPIPMPEGSSIFQFVRIEDGVSSSVESFNYNLKLNTQFTAQQAVEAVVSHEIKIGKIFDEAGYVDGEDEERYFYDYQYVKNINGAGDFYVIMESVQSKGGPVEKTGSYFAVNIYNREIFRLQIDGTNYTLVEIE